MTILHSGASRKFANNWLKIFGSQKSAKKGGSSSATKSAKQKAAKSAHGRKATPKKKSVAKKSGR
jgi:hypothetical protein